jgi:RimJ/RimL family protein N-acetyltransferase
MRFVRFGVTLERLESLHLEVVRQWRNSSWVRPYMRYREFIPPEQQAPWFESLDPQCDWYFLAHDADTPFALFHIKAINWSRACGESGGFVGNPAHIGSPQAARATLALMDFAFLVLELQSLEAQYRSDLHRVVQVNRRLGYLPFRNAGDGFLRACVSAARYFDCAAGLRRAAVTLHGVSAVLTCPDPWLRTRLAQHQEPSRPDFQLELC